MGVGGVGHGWKVGDGFLSLAMLGSVLKKQKAKGGIRCRDLKSPMAMAFFKRLDSRLVQTIFRNVSVYSGMNFSQMPKSGSGGRGGIRTLGELPHA